ncbi:MAG: ribose-5-phosphate isomerase RpiA [Spirochaetaceae bacterium]|jgi:ribose 5-phosphate isomerase A|nr:ribose-5-phosphate isomerase RpiA [Spirochaetaceae bacterium]
MDQNEIKALTGKSAVEQLVKSGMKLGLGTGSTALPAVRHLGLLLKEGKLSGIKAVSTSFQTSMECEKWGIPLYTLNSGEINGQLDLTIDGADEIDERHWCTKGGGGALLVEKITAYASSAFCVVVDESKLVKNLGLTFPVPLEVIPEARRTVTLALEKLGARVTLREALRKAGPVITEHGNLLLDLAFDGPADCAALETEFNRIPGVVENGFFTRIRPVVFVGRSNGSVEVKQ